jgi:heat shock transcription factor, other eukaryote
MEQQNENVQNTENAWGDDIEELERQAQIAKREAQAKRKQIPPFVQKLNRYVAGNLGPCQS